VVEQVLAEPGAPLDPATLDTMQRRLDTDFTRVRVHTDQQAAAGARAIDADAYTHGEHIGFGAGRFAPGTHRGAELLAHELTHVAQNQGAPRHYGELRVGARHDRAERHADAQATPGVIRRQVTDNPEPDSLDARYRAALRAAQDTGYWTDAAELLNGFSRPDILARIAELTPVQIGYLRGGAIDNPRVGPESTVAELTRSTAQRASTEAALTSSPEPATRTHSPGVTQSSYVDPVATMTPFERVKEAYRQADLGEAMRAKVRGAFTEEAFIGAIISLAVGFLVAQLTPVGWVADLTLGLTAIFIGTSVLSAIKHLIAFADARNATTSDEIKVAAGEFAQAIADLEIDAIILILTHGLAKGATGLGTPPEGPTGGIVLAVTPQGALVPAAAASIDAETAARLGIGIRTSATTGRGSTALESRAQRGDDPTTREHEPPFRDHTGELPPGRTPTPGDLKLGFEIPETDGERAAAVNSWSREELEEVEYELERSIPARNEEQQRLGETSVGPQGQRKGATHRTRISNEEALLRAVRKKLAGS
jgi:hypothetical protein